jgi:hypothetical protein
MERIINIISHYRSLVAASPDWFRIIFIGRLPENYSTCIMAACWVTANIANVQAGYWEVFAYEYQENHADIGCGVG